MIRFILMPVLAILVAGSFVGCDNRRDARATPASPLDAESRRHLEQEYPLPRDFGAKSILKMKRLALEGSAEDADKLAEMYENCLAHNSVGGPREGLPSESECKKQMEFWSDVAGENGDVSGAAARVYRVINAGTCEQAYRVKFSLSKAQKHFGTGDLKGALVELEKKQRECGW